LSPVELRWDDSAWLPRFCVGLTFAWVLGCSAPAPTPAPRETTRLESDAPPSHEVLSTQIGESAVVGRPAVLRDGRLVYSRTGNAPGETDLVLIDRAGH